MKFKAKLKYLRMSPRKVRAVCHVIKGMDVAEAENQLNFSEKNAAKPILKLIKSCAANAMHNNEVEKSNLTVSSILVNEGPTLKRWMPRAYGRATMLRKRSSTISVILEEKEPKAKKAKPTKEKKELEKPVMVSDYRSVPKGKIPDDKIEAKEEKKKDAEGEKKEIIDQSRVAKRHEAETTKPKGTGKKKGFIKRIFARKSG